MKNIFYISIVLFGCYVASIASAEITPKLIASSDYSNYQSNYNIISWEKRGTDNEYCLDIADDNGNLYQGLAPIRCGKDMYSFSPIDYVSNIAHTTLPDGFAFRWRVWSHTIDDQGRQIGQPSYRGNGYEGRVVVENPIPICNSPLSGGYPSGNVLSDIPDVSAFVGDKKKLWQNGSVLKYAINLNGTYVSDFSYVCNNTDTTTNCGIKIRDRIQQRASVWAQYGNISFQYTQDWNNADIRITFVKGHGAYSFIGTDSRQNSSDGGSMNLDATWWNNSWIDATITHEFGHAIGLWHEQLRSDTPYILNEELIYSYYARQGWDRNTTKFNVLDKINFSSSAYLTTVYDDKSIMRYPLERSFVINQQICPSSNYYYCVEPNTELSELDKSGIGKLYVKSSIPPVVTKYSIGSTGPAGGIVFSVDASGQHGLEVQRKDANVGGTTVDCGSTCVAGKPTYKYPDGSLIHFYNWEDAKAVASSYGAGWHLMTSDENYLMYGQENIGITINYSYWLSNYYTSTTGNFSYDTKDYGYLVRAVRAF